MGLIHETLSQKQKAIKTPCRFLALGCDTMQKISRAKIRKSERYNGRTGAWENKHNPP